VLLGIDRERFGSKLTVRKLLDTMPVTNRRERPTLPKTERAADLSTEREPKHRALPTVTSPVEVARAYYSAHGDFFPDPEVRPRRLKWSIVLGAMAVVLIVVLLVGAYLLHSASPSSSAPPNSGVTTTTVHVVLHH
jgi:hypothetical protein